MPSTRRPTNEVNSRVPEHDHRSESSASQDATASQLRRAGQACKRCQKRKIKCDAKPDGCTSCRAVNAKCEFVDRNTGQVYQTGARDSARDLLLEQQEKFGQLHGDLSRCRERYEDLKRRHLDDQAALALVNKKVRSDFNADDIPLTGNTYFGLKFHEHGSKLLLSTIEGSKMKLFKHEFDLSNYFPALGSEHSFIFDLTEREYFEHVDGTMQPSWPELPEPEASWTIATSFFANTSFFTPIVHQPQYFALLEQAYSDVEQLTMKEKIILQMVLGVNQFQWGIRSGGVEKSLGPEAKTRLLWSLQYFNVLLKDSSIEAFQGLTLICMSMRALQRPGPAWYCISKVMSYAIANGYHRSYGNLMAYSSKASVGVKSSHNLTQHPNHEDAIDKADPQLEEMISVKTSAPDHGHKHHLSFGKDDSQQNGELMSDKMKGLLYNRDDALVSKDDLQHEELIADKVNDLLHSDLDSASKTAKVDLWKMEEDLAHHIEMRQRVFWSLLVFHVHVSANLGRPMQLQHDDIDIEIPRPTPDAVSSGDNDAHSCTWQQAVYGFKLIDIMLQTYSQLRKVRISPRVRMHIMEDLLEELQDMRYDLPEDNALDPNVGIAFVTRVGNEYLKLAIHGTRLFILHMQHVCFNPGDATESELDELLKECHEILEVAKKLELFQSIDTTVYYNMYYIYAFFTIIWVEGHRSQSGRQHHRKVLKATYEEWLVALRSVGRYLGTQDGLHDEIKEIMMANITLPDPSPPLTASRPLSNCSEPYRRTHNRRESDELSGSTVVG